MKIMYRVFICKKYNYNSTKVAIFLMVGIYLIDKKY